VVVSFFFAAYLAGDALSLMHPTSTFDGSPPHLIWKKSARKKEKKEEKKIEPKKKKKKKVKKN